MSHNNTVFDGRYRVVREIGALGVGISNNAVPAIVHTVRHAAAAGTAAAGATFGNSIKKQRDAALECAKVASCAPRYTFSCARTIRFTF